MTHNMTRHSSRPPEYCSNVQCRELLFNKRRGSKYCISCASLRRELKIKLRTYNRSIDMATIKKEDIIKQLSLMDLQE